MTIQSREVEWVLVAREKTLIFAGVWVIPLTSGKRARSGRKREVVSTQRPSSKGNKTDCKESRSNLLSTVRRTVCLKGEGGGAQPEIVVLQETLYERIFREPLRHRTRVGG